jgi:hypothetical protein
METEVSLTANAATTALPTGYLQGKRLYLDKAIDTPLTQVSAQQLKSVNAGSETGNPSWYSVEADNFRWAPIPSGSQTIQCLYYKKFTAFSADGDTNDLLTNAPNVYLYGALLEAMPFLRNDQRIPLWAEMFGGAIDGLNESDESDRWSGSAMAMRTNGGTP